MWVRWHSRLAVSTWWHKRQNLTHRIATANGARDISGLSMRGVARSQQAQMIDTAWGSEGQCRWDLNRNKAQSYR